jgi:hypothetical protein
MLDKDKIMPGFKSDKQKTHSLFLKKNSEKKIEGIEIY